MVYLDLELHIESENCEKLWITPNSEWYFRVKCTQCREDHNKDIYFLESDIVEIKGSKGTAQFSMTCQ